MTRSETAGLDAFFQDIHDVPEAERMPAAASVRDRIVAELTDLLPELRAPPRLRERVVAAVAAARMEDRLERFAAPMAALLDIDVSVARAMLAKIDDPAAWFELLPGISLLPASGGPRVRGALRGFVKVRAGTEFPLHEHLGDEAVMIMQGYYADGVTSDVFGPGDTPVHPRDSKHSFRVLPDGPDLLGLVVARGGLRVEGQEFLAF